MDKRQRLLQAERAIQLKENSIEQVEKMIKEGAEFTLHGLVTTKTGIAMPVITSGQAVVSMLKQVIKDEQARVAAMLDELGLMIREPEQLEMPLKGEKPDKPGK